MPGSISCIEDTTVEKYDAELDQTQCRDLLELERPECLFLVSENKKVRVILQTKFVLASATPGAKSGSG